MVSASTGNEPSGTTIYSVAEAAGVSIATVSRVLQGTGAVSERTRDKVLEAIDRLDYMPLAAARSLAVRQHEALGLVLPELDGPYFSELLTGFEEAAAELELSVVLALVDRDRLLDAARFTRLAAGVDGVAVLGGLLPDDVLLRASRQKPLLVLAGTATPGLEQLAAENRTSAEELTAHLLDLHARTRPVFAGDPDIAPDVRQRYEGFARALTERGLEVPEPLGAGCARTTARRPPSGCSTPGCPPTRWSARTTRSPSPCSTASSPAASGSPTTSRSPAGTTSWPPATCAPASPRCASRSASSAPSPRTASTTASPAPPPATPGSSRPGSSSAAPAAVQSPGAPPPDPSPRQPHKEVSTT